MIRIGIIAFFGILLCHTAIGHGDVHVRIDILSEEIAEDRDNEMLYVKRAKLYLEDGDIKNTMNDIKKAQKLAGKDFPPALQSYAEMYHKLGSHDLALKYINSFLEQNPKHVIGTLTKARILEDSGNLTEAINFYGAVIENTSTPLPENYFRIINALELTGRNTEAVFYCEKAVRELGQLLVFEQRIIDLHLTSNNYNAAILQLDNIISRQDRKEKWHYQKAMIYHSMGDMERSTGELDAAMECIGKLPQRIQANPAMKTLTTRIKNQRDKAKPFNDDPHITGAVE